MPPPSNSKKKSLDELQEHQDERESMLPQITIITGLPGAGKTTLAASAFSPDVGARLAMPAKEIKDKPVIVLETAIWIGFDNQSTLALRGKRIKPRWHLDMATLIKLANGNVSQAIRDLHAYVEAAAEAGATGYVVDTATSFGGQWLVPEYVTGSDNGFTGWQTVGNEQLKLLNLGKDLGLRQWWLAQPTENKLETLAQSSKATEADKAKAQAQSVAGGSNYVVPALSGKVFPPVLNAQCSVSGWLQAREVNGKTTRTWMPYGGDGSRGKTRYEGILDQKEPADLFAMDQKILAAIGE